MTSRELVRLVSDAAQSKKARDVNVIDLRKKTSMADFFVVCEGDTDRQTKAIAEAVREEARAHGVHLYQASGEGDGTWILLDFIDVVVHIFLPGERAFYDLEALWKTSEARVRQGRKICMSQPLRAPVPPPPAPHRRARRVPRKSERTQRGILTAAKTLFDRRGYRDTTIDDITRRAEIAHGTFYLYFRDKSQLLEQLLAQTLGEFADIAAREPTHASEISDLIRQSLETYARNRLLMRLLREASAGDAYFREHYEEHFTGALVDHLTLSVTHIQASLPGGVDRVDPRAAARAIVGMVESFAYGMFIGGEDYSIDVAVETLSRFCSRAVGLPG